MPPDEAPARAALEEFGDPALVAAVVRAGIDALLNERAPAEREAFWRAVALYYAPPPKHRERPGSQTHPTETETTR